MLIRAVIFDLGGVLLRTEDPAPRRELAMRLGKDLGEIYYQVFDSPTAQLATRGELNAATHWEAVRMALGVSPDELPAIQAAFWAGDRLDISLVDYIRSLRSGYKTALLSNAWDDLRHYIEDHWKIADAFDELIISAEVGLAKPDLRIYQLALDRLRVSPPEAVFVDDFSENVDAARKLGLRAIHFQDRQQVCAEIKRLLHGG